jgi:hypothetical protein
VILREAEMTYRTAESEFDAPAVLAEGCGVFAGDPDEPGICGTCGWLVDEHADADLLAA